MKVVLVIDKPSQCIECLCYRQEQGEKLIEWCNVKEMRLTWQEVVKVPKWCPLVPMDAYDMLRDEVKKRMKHPERFAKR